MITNMEPLTQDSQGYIYWKGQHVEHYSFGYEQAAEETAAATELIARCKHLETLGVPVSCNTAIWRWGWYEGLTRDGLENLHPLVRSLLLTPRDLYEDALGRFAWIAESQPIGADQWKRLARVCVCDHGEQSSFMLESDDNAGYYHPLCALGWNTAQMGQKKDMGYCYATTEQLLAWFDARLAEKKGEF